ncbi:translation elongation factor Ts [Demequina sp.]|uniref:translation elongation factor Ts n=1 Tax=Demequina sp. TaxID=2050685 RepID=UPI0025BABA28|nr:translation elongation factor Ts [Demequina sp.]
MANYTVADIQALRERTGAGMLDVKKALDEAEGDVDKAVDVLRVKGLKGVSKREGRSASEGLVITHIAAGGAGQVGTLIEINSETDFVAKSGKFVTLAEAILKAVVDAGAADVDGALAAPVADGKTVKEFIDENAGVLGEKIVLRRMARVEAPVVVDYLHKTNKDLPAQVGVLVGSDDKASEVARDIAMHIAAYSPLYLSRDEVPADVVDNERRVAEETSRNEGKPEAALPKIIEGRMNGFFKENVLPEQAFAKDPKTTVGKVVAATGGEVVAFARFRVGA